MTGTRKAAKAPAGGVWGTVNGVPVTEDDVQRLVADAEAGFPDAVLRPVGRPRSVGDVPARTITVRLDPDRLQAVRERAAHEHTSTSEILRRALDDYLAS
ncbi:MAG TPA: ribbon-helix-helix protein, CopG family [Phycicoccus sp.]|jgi:hypothetical protein|nr:ribbon-helix-helix protein, CopG family [Phycicoccus sp.]HQH08995.1 ribbon-helix-helix protein, CopG family [Phycicoccus sp.]HQK32113.1 ribbon-helix-helix protein, CopG family [Phycicoccus sp.]